MNVKSYFAAGLCVFAMNVAFSSVHLVQANEVISQESLSQLININKADVSTLLSLKGIGHKKALAIVAYREQQGNFHSVDELLKVKGIGAKLFSSLKNKITI